MGENGTRLDRSADGDDEPGGDRSGRPPADGDVGLSAAVDDLGADSPAKYVTAVAELAAEDPSAAGDRVGDLLAIARDNSALVDDVDGVLDEIGWRRPVEFEVWTDDLVALAESADDDLAFIGLRSLAQLAGTRPAAATAGVGVALNTLTAPGRLRRPALTIVAEIGDEDPRSVRRADRPVAASLGHDDPDVRVAAAIAAGRLLGADPSHFPRTATALLETVDDDDDTVREFVLVALVLFATEHPTNVPERTRAIKALTAVSDDELGLTRGTTQSALYNLLELELGFESEDA